MTDIGVGGVTRTVARASDLSGARRTEFLFHRFVVERCRCRRHRSRFSRRRRTVAVALVAARHHRAVIAVNRIQTRASRRTHTIVRARVRTSDAIQRGHKRVRTRPAPLGKSLFFFNIITIY